MELITVACVLFCLVSRRLWQEVKYKVRHHPRHLSRMRHLWPLRRRRRLLVVRRRKRQHPLRRLRRPQQHLRSLHLQLRERLLQPRQRMHRQRRHQSPQHQLQRMRRSQRMHERGPQSAELAGVVLNNKRVHV
jgi:hypothetical protein